MDTSAGPDELECSSKVVKKERAANEDIKEFAENAMNELLGWYGYSGGCRENRPPKPPSCRSHSNSISSGPDSPKLSEGCGWCGKPVDESNGLSSGSSIFCSELCFSQSRRANFKKNKTCDWCRHVRHTVSYVDFQDGASQLQFCSDKCLNQYKMHIFCRETRAHLEMHPHLTPEDSASGLITPDLWMRNCKSPSSRSPSPQDDGPQTSPLPLISVAHPSKLLASPPEIKPTPRKPIKRTRKRPPSTITAYPKTPEVAQDLRIRHSPPIIHPEPPPFVTYPPSDPRLLHPPIFNPPNYLHRPPNLLPPVTVMVPYPVVIPVPVPIPIPLPLSSFLRAAELRDPPPPAPSQPEDPDDAEIIVDDPKEPTKPPPIRPLRKRKRVVDTKIKTKKTLSV